MKIVSLIGLPGAGKTTQAEMFCSANNATTISTGNLLRNLSALKNDLGFSIKRQLDDGMPISTQLCVEIVVGEIKKKSSNENIVIIDGSPRSVEEFDLLYNKLSLLSLSITSIVEIIVPLHIATNRIVSRCRSDDYSSSINRRVDYFFTKTSLVKYYADSKQIRYLTIDGNKGVDEVLCDLNHFIIK